MKIRKLQLKNIGVFDDETINFQECPAKDKAEIHILTGENGTGKTTILQALANSYSNYSLESPNQSFYNKFNLDLDFKVGIYNVTEPSPPFVQVNYEDATNVRLALIEEDDNFLSFFYSRGEIKSELLNDYLENVKHPNHFMNPRFSFAPFAYSGYRSVLDEKVEAIKELKDFDPLSQSTEFIKDYSKSDQLTINQLITNNISKSAIEKERDKVKSRKFGNVVKSIEQIICEITDWKVEFNLETEPLRLTIKLNNKEVDISGLPDGLLSLLSWVADLLSKVDLLRWRNNLPIFEKNLILFLDEIEVHLHPAWQRKVLPIVQKLFKNAQIFVSTHSPFVVNSVDDAWVYELEVNDGKAKVREVTLSNTAHSIQTVLREVFGIDERFGKGTHESLMSFIDKSRKIQKNNGNSGIVKAEFLELAIDLAEKSAELQSIVFVELAKITNKTGEVYEI